MKTISLWSDKWNEQALRDRCITLGDRDFNRGFRQIPFSSSDMIFPNFEKCIVSQKIVIPDGMQIFGGMDLASKNRPGTVIFTLGTKNNYFYPLDVQLIKGSSDDALQLLISTYEKYKHRAIFVENNALQSEIISWFQKVSARPMPIKPYHTGGQKHDPLFGLPGLDIEFSNKMWVIQQPVNHRIDCECGMCRWIKSMKQYPFSSETDTVMACWFAREASRINNSNFKSVSTGQVKDFKNLGFKI